MITTPDTDMPPNARTKLRKYRLAINLIFALAGMVIGAWTARIPSIQHHLQLTDSQLGIALLSMACGSLAGMRIAGRPIDRYGSPRIITLTTLVLGPALACTAYAPNLTALAVALLALGAVHGTLNVTMNAAAVACQTAYGRPIMTTFHAQFSIGGVAGALASAAAARAGLSVEETFTVVGAVLTAGALSTIRPLQQQTPSASAPSNGSSRPADREPRAGNRRVALLGLLAFFALMSEGAAADWSSVYLDRLGASPAHAAAGYAAFAGCMTLGRLIGDRITAAVDPVTLLRSCGLLAGTGLAIGLALKHPTAVLLGFACLGAGLSCVIPLLYSTAGNLAPDRAGAALSRVSSVGYLGNVTGPVIIGGAATPLGLSHALLLLPILAGVLVAAAPVVRPAAVGHAGQRTQPAAPSEPS